MDEGLCDDLKPWGLGYGNVGLMHLCLCQDRKKTRRILDSGVLRRPGVFAGLALDAASCLLLSTAPTSRQSQSAIARPCILNLNPVQHPTCARSPRLEPRFGSPPTETERDPGSQVALEVQDYNSWSSRRVATVLIAFRVPMSLAITDPGPASWQPHPAAVQLLMSRFARQLSDLMKPQAHSHVWSLQEPTGSRYPMCLMMPQALALNGSWSQKPHISGTWTLWEQAGPK